MKSKHSIIGIFILILFLQGCSISKNVMPVDSSKEINKIYVLKNDNVFMEGLHPELLKQLNDLGFETESYSGDLPKGAIHYMAYTANWSWDLAMYLVYFRANLYEEGKVLGEAEYDARMGGGNFSKFGHTADKIKPLLTEMLAKVRKKSFINQNVINPNPEVSKDSQ